jgi:hypothetical protein
LNVEGAQRGAYVNHAGYLWLVSSEPETGNNGYFDGVNVSGVQALANVIPGMGALSKLDASDNDMFGQKNKAGITAWADALKACTSIMELNLAKNGMDAEDMKILAAAISDMGAMTKFDISSNVIRADGGKALAAGLKGNQMITELNINSNELGQQSNGYGNDTSGVIAIADAIPDMGAMTSLDLSSNEFGAKVATHFAQATKVS